MSCSDIPTWYLRNRIPIIDIRSATWRRVRGELLPPGYEATTCLARLEESGVVRQLGRGRWQVVEPSREPPLVALADALFQDQAHYITTDAALAAEGLIDQPLTTVTVVVQRRVRPVMIGATKVRAVWMASDDFAAADVLDTSRDGYRVRLASALQAVVDALAEPRWMVHATLLREVVGQIDTEDMADAARRALVRSKAAAARLGFLLEEADRPIPPVLRDFQPVSKTELRPGKRGPYSTRWQVYG